MALEYFQAVGRRKSSIARVRLQSGTGNFTVNEKTLLEYFPRFGDSDIILSPFEAIGDSLSRYDVSVHTLGGGVSGQAGAIRMGLARALIKMDSTLRSKLRAGDHLTRDPREKERKKPGLKRARKAPTYTKR